MRKLALALVFVAAAGTGALARSEKVLAYPRDQAWSAVVRFLVVDERVKVTDKDEGAGYVVFEVHDDDKVYRGSLELIAMDKDGRKVVRFVAQIEDRPAWLEVKLLDRLEHKLRVELGSPDPAKTPPPKKDPEKDKDKDGDAPKRPAEPPKDDGGPPISPTP